MSVESKHRACLFLEALDRVHGDRTREIVPSGSTIAKCRSCEGGRDLSREGLAARLCTARTTYTAADATLIWRWEAGRTNPSRYYRQLPGRITAAEMERMSPVAVYPSRSRRIAAAASRWRGVPR